MPSNQNRLRDILFFLASTSKVGEILGNYTTPQHAKKP